MAQTASRKEKLKRKEAEKPFSDIQKIRFQSLPTTRRVTVIKPRLLHKNETSYRNVDSDLNQSCFNLAILSRLCWCLCLFGMSWLQILCRGVHFSPKLSYHRNVSRLLLLLFTFFRQFRHFLRNPILEGRPKCEDNLKYLIF